MKSIFIVVLTLLFQTTIQAQTFIEILSNDAETSLNSSTSTTIKTTEISRNKNSKLITLSKKNPPYFEKNIFNESGTSIFRLRLKVDGAGNDFYLLHQESLGLEIVKYAIEKNLISKISIKAKFISGNMFYLENTTIQLANGLKTKGIALSENYEEEENLEEVSVELLDGTQVLVKSFESKQSVNYIELKRSLPPGAKIVIKKVKNENYTPPVKIDLNDLENLKTLDNLTNDIHNYYRNYYKYGRLSAEALVMIVNMDALLKGNPNIVTLKLENN